MKLTLGYQFYTKVDFSIGCVCWGMGGGGGGGEGRERHSGMKKGWKV